MRRLGQHYVQYFNRRHQRSGTLWEGRFRSCLVDHERYLLTCQRYIELNPVRAEAERRASYRHLFGEVISNDLLKQIRHASNSNSPLGSASFAHIHATLGYAPKTGCRGRPKVRTTR
jgi:putative transposase